MGELALLGSFGIVAVASGVVGGWFKQIQLPAITGFLFVGALVGSFGLDLIPSESSSDLRFVDEIALAVIAFVAGSELFVKEIRPRLKSIAGITAGVIMVSFVALTAGIYALTAVVSFTRDLAEGPRLATAVLGSAVLLALSPPSTIAVIKDLRARGEFTRTVLGVTITMDVAIVVLFATMTSLAAPLLTDASLDPSFVLILAADLVIAGALGWVGGQLLAAVVTSTLHRLAKIGLVLLIGFGIYELADFITATSPDVVGFELHMEPLLVALIAGFVTTNYTPARDEFAEILHDVGPPVYVAFFTLTGLSLKLDILVSVLPVALALFAIRAVGIAAGSWLGASWAGEPTGQRRLFWAGFITQAGIALGLAREVAVQFPSLGDAFATLIISVVVINEVVGPLFLRSALRRVGETNEPSDRFAIARRAVVFGVEGQSIELARALRRADWTVTMADPDHEHLARAEELGTSGLLLADLDEATIRDALGADTDAVVAMLADDDLNGRIMRVATDVGVSRKVVRPANPASAAALSGEDGLTVVDPTSAIVTLLEQSVTSPQSTSLIMHADPDRQMTQLAVTNPDVDGMPVRDLRLPPDLLLLQVVRANSTVVVSGHTQVRLGDEIVALGTADSLDAARIRFGS